VWPWPWRDGYGRLGLGELAKMPGEPLLCDDGTEWRVAFRHVMLGLAGRNEQRPVKRQKDKPMTDTVLRGMGRTRTLQCRAPSRVQVAALIVAEIPQRRSGYCD